MKRRSPLQASGNPFKDRARALKAQRLALILWEVGMRRAGEVHAMGPDARALALRILAEGTQGPGLGPGGRARTAQASEETWRAVASLVGYLGGGSGGRRRISRTVPIRIGVDGPHERKVRPAMDTNEDGLTFDAWRLLVDLELAKASGLCASSLADYPAYDHWADGMSPLEAAYVCLVEWNDFPEELWDAMQAEMGR